MKDILETLASWNAAGERFALATVINVDGSAPRDEGATMLIAQSGKIAGSVSGGCVEGAVIEEGMKAIADGAPRLLTFGVSNERAWEVGLACGGKIRVFVERVE